jgi:hypothetical protein
VTCGTSYEDCNESIAIVSQHHKLSSRFGNEVVFNQVDANHTCNSRDRRTWKGHREGCLAGLVEVWSPKAQVQNTERPIAGSKVEEPLRQGREEDGRLD